MIEIGRTIVSFEVLEEYFLCDLLKCKGACCVEGTSGAPVTEEEANEIEQAYPVFLKYMPELHRQEVERQGFTVIDSDGDLVTPLINNRECVYTFTDEQGILKCAIEKAFLAGKISFRKPVSCHLFPIRITEYKRFDAINYQELKICKPGRICGSGEKLHLYKFLKEPLIRKYGGDWYEQLIFAAENLSIDDKP